jgi:hypothetical protein
MRLARYITFMFKLVGSDVSLLRCTFLVSPHYQSANLSALLPFSYPPLHLTSPHLFLFLFLFLFMFVLMFVFVFVLVFVPSSPTGLPVLRLLEPELGLPPRHHPTRAAGRAGRHRVSAGGAGRPLRAAHPALHGGAGLPGHLQAQEQGHRRRLRQGMFAGSYHILFIRVTCSIVEVLEFSPFKSLSYLHLCVAICATTQHSLGV